MDRTWPMLAIAGLVLTIQVAASASGSPNPLVGDHRISLPGLVREQPLGGEGTVCYGGRRVALIVDPAYIDAIRGGLSQFETDLCGAGYSVVERQQSYPNAGALRAYLQALFMAPGPSLAGAILIGAQPHAYQWVTLTPSNPQFPPLSEEAISFQYYTDLDGTFSASGGYSSPGGHAYSFDQHTGALDWEIWLGVLPVYKGNHALTVEALNRYFAKNHAYRMGSYSIPHQFLEISEHFIATTPAESNFFLDGMREGQYAWVPFSNAVGALLYFHSPPAGLTVGQGYNDLAAGVADITVLGAHGFWGASGQLTIADVESTPVKTVLLWSDGCAVGNLDRPDNFLTSSLYSATSQVLIAKGTTNDSGGMGTNADGFVGANVAGAIAGGQGFGDAVLEHVNTPLIHPWSLSREFHLGTPVFLGDPTLVLR